MAILGISFKLSLHCPFLCSLLVCRHGRKLKRQKRKQWILWKYAKETQRISKRKRGGKRRGLTKMLKGIKWIKICDRNRTKPSFRTEELIKNVMTVRLPGWSKSAYSTARWSTCKGSRISSRLKLWNTWLEARSRNNKTWEHKNKHWRDNSRGWT